MTLKLYTLLLMFVTNFRFCQSKSYENFTLFNVFATNMDQLKFLQNVGEKKYIEVVFWKMPRRLYEDIQLVVNPTDVDIFLERVDHFKVPYRVLLDNVQSAFNNQNMSRYLQLKPESFSFDNYYSLEDIYQWIGDLAERYPNMVSVETIGKSTEDRDIYAVGIKRASYPRGKVIVEGGVHGHEWISVAFVTYLINELLDAGRSDDLKFKFVAKSYEWFLIPIVNPDGYDYTIKEDRLWRKNRRVFSGGVGVDLDRNFNFSFGKHDSKNHSSDPYYCGPEPLSEKETKTLANFIKAKQNRLKYYFSIHAYGQKVIIPFGDRLSKIGNYNEMENFAKQGVVKMYSRYEDKFEIGNAFDMLGTRVSGDSADYVKQNFRVEYVFTLLLRDNGSYGYALPASEIRSTCEETLLGMVEMMTAKQKYMPTNLFGRSMDVNSSELILVLSVLIITLMK